MPDLSRRSFATTLGALALSMGVPRTGRAASAEAVQVPIALQAKLIAKVAAFDRNMVGRAGTALNILVLRVPGVPESERAANQLELHLARLGQMAGVPVSVKPMDFRSAADLARECRDGSISIVYLTPGLKSALPNIAKALAGLSILSVSAVHDHVYEGAVLAFGLAEGKPKIFVHLSRAKRQQVDFKASFLRLARVVDT
jgi:hypothetical protein